MHLELDPGKVDEFERRIGDFGPWMHAYRLGDSLLTGYFKYEGLGDLTYVNRHSPPGDIERMRHAHALRDRHSEWPAFVESLFDRAVPARSDRATMHLLDVASATGQLSLRAVQAGFGRVTSSEIRAEQVGQQRLLLDFLRDPVYRERVTVIHDPVSADDASFPDRYRADQPDIVCSFGLLYHLAHPLQHLINVHAIARSHAIVYTMTHAHPLAKNMWYLTVEDPRWITKATSSVSWTPHFLEVARLCRLVGFRRVTISYPEIFRRRFPEVTGGYSRWTDAKLVAQMALQRLTGIRIGHMRNLDFREFQYASVNPNYVAYICEK